MYLLHNTNVTNQRTITLSIHITELLSITKMDCIFIYSCYQYEIKMCIVSIPSQHGKMTLPMCVDIMSRVE